MKKAIPLIAALAVLLTSCSPTPAVSTASTQQTGSSDAIIGTWIELGSSMFSLRSDGTCTITVSAGTYPGTWSRTADKFTLSYRRYSFDTKWCECSYTMEGDILSINTWNDGKTHTYQKVM